MADGRGNPIGSDQTNENDLSESPRTLIGKPPNHWMHSTDPATFDLTRPKAPDYPVPDPKSSIRLKTTTSDILVAPVSAALVIVDMQNFFLSTALGRDPNGAGNKAREILLKHTIPAARAAGIRTIWVNWGLTDQDLDGMPPATRRAFGFEASLNRAAKVKSSLPQPAIDPHGVNQTAAEQILANGSSQKTKILQELTENGKPKRLYQGLGSEIGPVKLENGKTVDGGRLLFADTWNASMTPDLLAEYEKGLAASPPDVWIHKNRMSGLWGASTPTTEFLEREGIKTLLFAGVNTDQCVLGSLTDAFSKGYDCIFLSDACGTTSPDFAQQSCEFNAARTYGFVTSSPAFANGVDEMISARS